jgi:hypothetical protein
MLISEYWEGHLTGGSRGRLLIRFREVKPSEYSATALFLDQRFGHSIVNSSGRVVDAALELRMRRFHGAAPFLPLDGALSLTFSDGRAKGIWNTDLGMFGVVVLRPSTCSVWSWWVRRIAYSVAARVQLVAPAIYLIAVVLIALLSLRHSFHIDLGLPSLILLLVPAPFLLRWMIARMVNSLKEMGLEQFWLIRFLQPKAQPIGALERVSGPGIPVFDDLNLRFAPATKQLLCWLALRGWASLEEFAERAVTFAVIGDNLNATVNILSETGCVAVNDRRITILPFGRQYVAFFFRGTVLDPQGAST